MGVVPFHQIGSQGIEKIYNYVLKEGIDKAVNPRRNGKHIVDFDSVLSIVDGTSLTYMDV